MDTGRKRQLSIPHDPAASYESWRAQRPHLFPTSPSPNAPMVRIPHHNKQISTHTYLPSVGRKIQPKIFSITGLQSSLPHLRHCRRSIAPHPPASPTGPLSPQERDLARRRRRLPRPHPAQPRQRDGHERRPDTDDLHRFHRPPTPQLFHGDAALAPRKQSTILHRDLLRGRPTFAARPTGFVDEGLRGDGGEGGGGADDRRTPTP